MNNTYYSDELKAAGALVRSYRKRRNMSLRKLAMAIGLAPTSISRMEAGHFPLGFEATAALIDILDVEPVDVSALVATFGAQALSKAAQWQGLTEAASQR